MKLYNIKLEEISIVDDLKSWQGPYLHKTLIHLNLNSNICLIDMCRGSVLWEQLGINETVTSINNSEVDVIFFLMTDHRYHNPLIDTESKLYKIMTSITKPVIYIVWDYIKDDNLQQIKYTIWATLCVTFNKYVKTEYINYSDVDITTIHKKYLYSSLSNVVYGFRLVNLVEFQKSNYYNKSLITFNVPTENKLTSEFWSWEIQQFGQSYASQFKKILPTLPINTATSPEDNMILANGIIDNDIVFDYNNAAYANSYVNVVVESIFESIFFSEKTFKPMLASQFFVIISGKGSIAMLREMGFDTYDDIIDHSRYDNSPNNIRIQAVHALLHDMQHYDWEQIYKDTVERREKNRQLLLDLPFEKTFLLELQQMITTIVKPT